jgi:LmbE family N-acetylglucosaminyl deacetylase
MNKGAFSKLQIFLLIIGLQLSGIIYAQPVKEPNSSEIRLALKKLNVLGSVLYIAAHPDDENTALLSYFSSGKLLRTGYLSLTRGDGGQNLIGSEQGELLGLIRTQELLDARRIDGAEQYFTRAYDFGFTKSPEETFSFWGKEKILSDVVWLIRKFRPDVILTRFPVTGEGGHGHHTASAILTEEAFNMSGDPKQFPEQLKYVKPWQPVRLLWNLFPQFMGTRNNDLTKLPQIDIGAFNPYLGKSYTEISAESRSMHKSQGFGTGGQRGTSIQYFEPREGSSVNSNIFENLNLTWARVNGSEKLSSLLSKAEKQYNPVKPEEIIPLLTEAYKEMDKVNEDYWIPIKRKELVEVIRSILGLWTEVIANDYSSSPGQELTFTAAAVNRSNIPVKLKSIYCSFCKNDSVVNANLEDEKIYQKSITLRIPPDAPLSQPYWLEYPHDKGSFTVNDQQLIGKPENEPSAIVNFNVSINNTDIPFTTSLLYRWIDPVKGEKYRPFEIVPSVSVNIDDKLFLFPDNNPKKIIVHVIGNSPLQNGKLRLLSPPAWKVTPTEIPFTLEKKGDEKQVEFEVFPPSEASEVVIKAEALVGDRIYNKGIIRINYDHIPIQTYLPDAESRLVRLITGKTVNRIGYIIGSGDNTPDYLTQLGYNVTFLSDEDLLTKELSSFDAVIAGVRVYNTKKFMPKLQNKLMQYISDGGNLIVQYTVNRDIVVPQIGPYPFTISTDRVTDENATINLLEPNSPLLDYPNKIDTNDFEGWIQERGLYFAIAWDKKYQTVISCNDPGRKPLEGGLLMTHFGKGNFIYTGYSFFRQIPAGVPGAIRFFINLISVPKNKVPK